MSESYPLLTLAYLGDAYLCLLARRTILEHGITAPAECTKTELLFVQACYQAEAAKELLPLLTETERALFLRAKNTKSHSAPRHTDRYTYRLATGMETLYGQWYLGGEYARAEAFFAQVFEKTIAKL